MAEITLAVDGNDLSSLGLQVVRGIRGWRARPPVSWPRAEIPGRIGAQLTAVEPRIGPRILEVPCLIKGTSASNFRSRLRDINDHLDASRVGDMSVTLSTDTSLEFRARAAEASDQLHSMALADSRTQLVLRFWCPDPRIYETSSTSTNFSGATAIPLGRAPSGYVIRIDGAATNPTVTYKDSGGTAQGTLDFTITLGAGEWVEVDTATGEVVDDGGADQSGAINTWDFFELDPQDGEGTTSTWPTLETDAGSGSATYTKAYFAGE